MPAQETQRLGWPGDRERSTPWLGVVADDYTGATDLAGMLVREGTSAIQFFGIPSGGRVPPTTDCLVVALKSRSIPSEEAVKQSLAAAEWLLSQGVETLFFKYCSTFDSTPEGNIGPVADALADLVGASWVPIAPAVPENGRTVYQGHLFVHGQLLNESPMRHHPLNPMTDSSLLRLFCAQSTNRAGLIPLEVVAKGAVKLERALADLAVAGHRFAVVDAVTDRDLETLGLALVGQRLVTGAAGLGVGLARARLGSQEVGGGASIALPEGPAVVLSGSCSVATRQQVARYREVGHPAFEIRPRHLVDGGLAARAVEFVMSRADDAPLVYSSAEPDEVAGLQRELGAREVAAAVEETFAEIARSLVEQGFRRLIVAGGETSGAVVRGIGLSGIKIGQEVDPGVPWTVSIDEPPIALLLKSGNFGGPDIFERSVR
jgi:uncharacterized protein YgbK (DUF1537 family)